MQTLSTNIDWARRITERLRIQATNYVEVHDKIVATMEEAREGGAAELLGYPSWTAYLADVLGSEPLRLERDARRQLVKELSDEGMSTRAIAPIVGVSHMQVANDIHTEQAPAVKNFTPEPVKVTETVKTETFIDAGTGEVVEELPTVATNTGTIIAEQRKVTIGLDGKEYKRPEPKPAKQIDWEQKNADQMANALANSLNLLHTLQNERKRQIFINEWIPRGQDAVPPDPRKLFNPGVMRAIASYLVTFANELESNNEH